MRERGFPGRRRPAAAAALAAAFALALAAASCGLLSEPEPDPKLVAEVDAWLKDWTERYVELVTASSEAEWALNTHIVEGDDSNKQRVEEANRALARYAGSVDTIETVQGWLERRAELEPLQVRQLEAILYMAADKPQTVPELVERRISAEAAQTETLFGFQFEIDGRAVSANEIDRILEEDWDEFERLKAWSASKEVGKELDDGLAELVDLRNRTVQALGYDDFFHYQVSDYGMTVPEMMRLMDRLIRELRPLYREIHTWARHELAERFDKPAPPLIPAHWLPNRWGQSWAALVDVEGLDLDAAISEKEPEWVVRQAEDFYISLGFDPLPEAFWGRSSLYPLPPDAPYKKNNHASAWHMDLDRDVRCLMSVEPNARWYETTHHELGHIYYFLSYARPEVPPLLREGANRAFHEAVGSLMGMVSMHRAYLEERGLVSSEAEVDRIRVLLKEALDFIVFNPFSAGTMTHFEHDLYAGGLEPGRYNRRWWSYVREYQGIAPPYKRGEEYCDAVTKTHINNDPAQYYDYTLSQVILHQLHAHIAREILRQDLHNTNYYGSRKVGDFLRDILEEGATRDWREVLREAVGEEISARAMLEYFEPLREWLEEQNAGREATLPEL